MDQALQIALVYDAILIVLFAAVFWVAWMAGKAIHEFTKVGDGGADKEETEAAYKVRLSAAQGKAARLTSIAVLLIIMLFVYANRETIWFRPEPKPVVNPERSLRVEEVAGRKIIVNEPVNVPERQKLDPEDLAVKDKVEEMEDLKGGPNDGP